MDSYLKDSKSSEYENDILPALRVCAKYGRVETMKKILIRNEKFRMITSSARDMSEILEKSYRS